MYHTPYSIYICAIYYTLYTINYTLNTIYCILWLCYTRVHTYSCVLLLLLLYSLLAGPSDPIRYIIHGCIYRHTCLYTYTCMHAYMRTYTKNVRVHVIVHIHVYVHIYIHTYVPMDMHVCLSVCLSEYLGVALLV